MGNMIGILILRPLETMSFIDQGSTLVSMTINMYCHVFFFTCTPTCHTLSPCNKLGDFLRRARLSWESLKWEARDCKILNMKYILNRKTCRPPSQTPFPNKRSLNFLNHPACQKKQDPDPKRFSLYPLKPYYDHIIPM